MTACADKSTFPSCGTVINPWVKLWPGHAAQQKAVNTFTTSSSDAASCSYTTISNSIPDISVAVSTNHNVNVAFTTMWTASDASCVISDCYVFKNSDNSNVAYSTETTTSTEVQITVNSATAVT